MAFNRDIDNRNLCNGLCNTLKIHKEPKPQYSCFVLRQDDPRYTFEASKQAISDEINGRLHRNAFQLVKQKKYLQMQTYSADISF